MHPPTISRIIHRSLFYWLLLPCLLITALVGVYTALWMRAHFTESSNLAVETLSRHVQATIGDASHGLAALCARLHATPPGNRERLMADFLDATPHLSRLIYLGPGRRIEAAVPPGTRGHDFPLELSEVKSASLILSRPFLSPATGRLAIYLGHVAPDGLALVGELNLEQLQSHIQSLKPLRQGRIVLTDAFGNVISHPDEGLIARQENLGGLELVRESGPRPTTSLYRDADGLRFGTAIRLQDTGWVVLASASTTTVLAPILRSTAILLVLVAGMLIFVTIRTRQVLGERVVEPLEHFTQAIPKVAAGDYAAVEAVHPFASRELAQAEHEFIAMARTIRAREEELRESEGRFRQVVENVREVFWVRDMATEGILYLSPAFEAVFGLPRETVEEDNQAFYRLLLDEDKPRVREAYDRLRRDRLPMDLEYRIRKPDGSLAWIRSKAFPVEDRRGEYTRIVGIAEDITEAKRYHQSLQTIVQGTSSTTGSQFFYSLTQTLAEALEAPHALVTEFLGDPPDRARTLAFWRDGGHADNFEYDLAGTPSDAVREQGFCCNEGDLQERFPGDTFLRELDARAYMGIALVDSQGRPAGHLAVLTPGTLPEERTARSILAVFSARAGAELERLRAERAIAQSLREKEILLKEIHHRVKNNLQVISSLLNLQMLQVTDPLTIEMLEESRDRIRSIALVHEELYRFNDLAHIDVGAYVATLAKKLTESHARPGIVLERDVDDASLPVNSAVPMGLILNELLTNAFKHAFPGTDRGRIFVRFREEPERFVLRVEDDGVGMPTGFRADLAESLGMQLIHNLTLQLRGTLEMATPEGGQGSAFTITFPKEA